MTIPTTGINESSPAGSDNINQGDNKMREFKVQNREILEINHVYPSSGQDADAGKHKQIDLVEQADLGTGATGYSIIGGQTVSGKPELVYTDEDDNDVQLTSAGKLGSSSTDLLCNDQTVSGTLTANDIASKSTTNVACGFVPIGGIIPWAKTLTGVPALPANFVECSGQTLSDAESALDGQVIPDLNGDNRVLVGNSTSGGTSTNINQAHTHTTPAHQHTLKTNGDAPGRDFLETANGTVTNTTTYVVSSGGGTSGSSGSGASYDVVWIMRIK